MGNPFGAATLEFISPIPQPMSDATDFLRNLTLARVQENTIQVSVLSEVTSYKQEFDLYQLHSGRKKFMQIASFESGTGPGHKFEIPPSSLLKETGSFYIRSKQSLVGSYSTGLLDLSQKETAIGVISQGIQPVQCRENQDGGWAQIEWKVSDSVRESCVAGYSVVTTGPKSDYKTINCGLTEMTLSPQDLDIEGTYGIRIESRENKELGIGLEIQSSPCWSSLLKSNIA